MPLSFSILPSQTLLGTGRPREILDGATTFYSSSDNRAKMERLTKVTPPPSENVVIHSRPTQVELSEQPIITQATDIPTIGIQSADIQVTDTQAADTTTVKLSLESIQTHLLAAAVEATGKDVSFFNPKYKIGPEGNTGWQGIEHSESKQAMNTKFIQAVSRLTGFPETMPALKNLKTCNMRLNALAKALHDSKENQS